MDMIRFLPSRAILLFAALLSFVSAFFILMIAPVEVAYLFWLYSLVMITAAGLRQKIQSDYLRSVFYSYLIFFGLIITSVLHIIISTIFSGEYDSDSFSSLFLSCTLIIFPLSMYYLGILESCDDWVVFLFYILSWPLFFMLMGYIFLLIGKSRSSFVRGKGRVILAIVVFVILGVISFQAAIALDMLSSWFNYVSQ